MQLMRVCSLLVVLRWRSVWPAPRPRLAPLVERGQGRQRRRRASPAAKRADPNAAEVDGTTALHWAAHLDDVAGADLLIEAGAKARRPIATASRPLVARVHQRKRRRWSSAC